jgi:hypothetical protein
VWFLDNSVTRYQQFLPQLAAAQYAPDEIDVVFIGQSGLLTFVNSKKIAESLNSLSYRTRGIVDISRNWEGVGSHFVSIRDLVETSKPKVIAVQYREADEREHAAFHQIGKIGDLFQSSFSVKTRTVLWKLQRSFQLLGRKLVDSSNALLAGRYSLPNTKFEQLTYIDPTPDADRVSKNARDAWIEKVGPADLEERYSWSLHSASDARSRSYYRRLADLADEIESELVLIDLPLLNRSPLDAEFLKLSEEEYGAHVFTFSKDALIELYPEGYADHGHGSSVGQDIFAREIAQFLTDRGLLQ